MSGRRRFERTLVKQARLACRARSEWHWRSWVNRIYRSLERILVLVLSPIGIAGVIVYPGFLAMVFLSGWSRTPKNQLLPLALLGVALMGASGVAGYSWRKALAKLKSLAHEAVLPRDDNIPLASQSRMAIGVCGILIVVVAWMLGYLLMEAASPVVAWVATIGLLAAQWGMLYYTVFVVSLLLERPRAYAPIRSGLLLMSICPLVVTGFGPSQAAHAGELARFVFTFLPTGWALGAFYHGVLHAEWRGVLFLLPMAPFSYLAHSLIRARMKIYGFSFEPPAIVSAVFFPLEELEAEEHRVRELSEAKVARTRDAPIERPWNASDLREAMFPPASKRSGDRVNRWLRARLDLRSRTFLEAIFGDPPPHVPVWLLATMAGLLVLFDRFVPPIGQAPTLMRSFYLTVLTVPNSLSNREKSRQKTVNLGALTRLPFAWSELIRSFYWQNLIVGLPLLAVAAALAWWYCLQHGVTLSYALPGYVAWPYVLLTAPALWVIPSAVVARPWRFFLLVPLAGAYLWGSIWTLSDVTQSLNPTWIQYAMAIFTAPLAGWLLERVLRRLYYRGWIDLG